MIYYNVFNFHKLVYYDRESLIHMICMSSAIVIMKAISLLDWLLCHSIQDEQWTFEFPIYITDLSLTQFYCILLLLHKNFQDIIFRQLFFVVAVIELNRGDSSQKHLSRFININHCDFEISFIALLLSVLIISLFLCYKSCAVSHFNFYCNTSQN